MMGQVDFENALKWISSRRVVVYDANLDTKEARETSVRLEGIPYANEDQWSYLNEFAGDTSGIYYLYSLNPYGFYYIHAHDDGYFETVDGSVTFQTYSLADLELALFNSYMVDAGDELNIADWHELRHQADTMLRARLRNNPIDVPLVRPRWREGSEPYFLLLTKDDEGTWGVDCGQATWKEMEEEVTIYDPDEFLVKITDGTIEMMSWVVDQANKGAYDDELG